MRALTLWQPWASCIAYYGKRIENRVWKAPTWMIGNELAIHAGMYMDKAFHAELMQGGSPAGAMSYATAVFPRGFIIATAILKACVTESEDQWFTGPYGWVLEDVRPLAIPIPIRGHQKLWHVPDEVRKIVDAQKVAGNAGRIRRRDK